ncbi:hypothetical protein D3C72_1449140 [compost metagenome]
MPVEHRVAGALHHGAHGQAPLGEVVARRIDGPAVGHHQDHRTAGGLLGLDVFPSAHLDALHQVLGAAHRELAEPQQALEADPDRGHQNGVPLCLALLLEADGEVGSGDVDLLLRDLEHQGRQGVSQLVTQTGRHIGEHAEHTEGEPAQPVTRVQQTGLEGRIKHGILGGHGYYQTVKVGNCGHPDR